MKTVDIEPIINSIKLEPASIETYAEWKQSLAQHIIEKNNIYWHEAIRGFYQPIHIMQKLSKSEIKAPVKLSWGVRGALNDNEKHLANGSIHYYTLENLRTFDFGMFSQKRRENIRKCFRRVEIREIRDENILLEQGYDIVKSSLERTQHAAIPPKAAWLKKCTAFVNSGDNSHLVLGAFLENKLLAFLELYAVEETVYLVTMMISSEALKFAVSAGLFYTSYVISQHSGNITKMFAGGKTGSHVSLDVFKQSMGMSITRAPFWCDMHKPARMYLKYRKPLTYRGLVGESA